MRAKVDEKVKRQVVELRMEGLGAASIWIDEDNRFDLITEKREDSVYADLAVKIRVEK